MPTHYSFCPLLRANSRNQEILQRFKKVVAEQLEIEEKLVILKVSFANDLGADFLDIVELVMALEEFDIKIIDEVAKQVDVVGKAVELIAKAVEN